MKNGLAWRTGLSAACAGWLLFIARLALGMTGQHGHAQALFTIALVTLITGWVWRPRS